MADAATIIKDIIVAEGLGTFGTDLFVGVLPDTPDELTSIRSTGGLAPNPRWRLDQPTAQVTTRASRFSYPTAYDRALQVKNVLLGRDPLTLGTDKIIGIVQISDVTFVGYDEADRPLFTSNWLLTIQRGDPDQRDPLP